jgi:hypothetical protein
MTCLAPQESSIRDNQLIVGIELILPSLAWVPTQATYRSILSFWPIIAPNSVFHKCELPLDFTCVPPHGCPFWPLLRSKCITYRGGSSRYLINIDYSGLLHILKGTNFAWIYLKSYGEVFTFEVAKYRQHMLIFARLPLFSLSPSPAIVLLAQNSHSKFSNFDWLKGLSNPFGPL